MSRNRTLRLVVAGSMTAGVLVMSGQGTASAAHDSCSVAAIVVDPVARDWLQSYLRERTPITAEGRVYGVDVRVTVSEPHDVYVMCQASTAGASFKIDVRLSRQIRWKKIYKKTIRWSTSGTAGAAGHFLLDGLPPRPCVEDLRVTKLHLKDVNSAIERFIVERVNERLKGRHCMT